MPLNETGTRSQLDPRNADDVLARLRAKVETVRTRHHRNFLATGLLLGLAVFAAVFLVFSVADIFIKLSVGTRIAALASALAGVGAAGFYCVFRPWLRLGGTVRVANKVETAYPELEEQLSTALEYGSDPEFSERHSSPALVSALAREAERRAEPLDFSRTIRWKPVVAAALAAIVFVLLCTGYAISQRRLFAATWARFFRPTAEIPPPTLTVITHVDPGDKEVPMESSVPISVELDGSKPETATLSAFIADESASTLGARHSALSTPLGRWEDRPMDRGEDGLYHASLNRLLDTMRYRIRAGDAESADFRIDVFKVPEITDFALRLEHPAYTGRGSETLAPGVGDVRALKGTLVHVELKANVDLAAATLKFKSGHASTAGTLEAADRRRADLAFNVESDDEYQIQIADAKGKTGAGSLYLVKVLKDRAPKVTIRKPEKDLMAYREQTVEIEISADDDIGVGEIGIFHSLGLEEKKTMVRRLDPAIPRVDGKLVWELGNLKLKGGEVIAYYAYALDNDTIGGPKMAKSEIQFLTIYDEQKYDEQKNPQQKKPGTPPAIKQLDKLIEAQKKLLKETFGQARQKESAEKPDTEAEKAAALKTMEGQKNLRALVQSLVDKVTEELKHAEEMGIQPRNTGNGPPPPHPGLGETELKHMESAIGKMAAAEKELKVPNTPNAVRPETEALRHLSETRRLLLSDKEGDPRFKMAMNNQSKQKRQKEQEQQQQDQQQAKQELAEMPRMMDREKQLERELEQLNERRRQKPPPAAQTEQAKQEQEEQRRLQRKAEEEARQLAREAEERAKKLDDLAGRNNDMQPAADKMQQAAEKLQKAANNAQQTSGKGGQEAQEQARQAHNDSRDAQRSLRSALEKQVRQELANLQKDAQDLAQRQQDLAQQARQLQPSAASEQRLKGMAGEQRDLQSDLKDLADRTANAAEKAAEQKLAGAPNLEQAKKQGAEDAAAAEAMQKAQDALSSAKLGDAQRESAKAAKAADQFANTLQQAVQKTAAGDMKALAGAMKKLQALISEQTDIEKALADKKDPAALGQREEQIASSTREVAESTASLETLRQSGRDGSTRKTLDEAVKESESAASSMKDQDAAGAKVPAERADKALNQALSEMERAAGKTLEEKAREAKAFAKAARENQEKAVEAAKDIQQPPAGQKLSDADAAKRDEAAGKENQAARDAKRLEDGLDGLQELARDANPAAADAAREARETSRQIELPKTMQDLATDIERLGTDQKENDEARARTPREAVRKGEVLNDAIRGIEKNLDAYMAEAVGNLLDRLRSTEAAARDAAKSAQALAEKNTPGEDAGNLEKAIQRLLPKLERLEAGAREKTQAAEALHALQTARQPESARKTATGAQPQPGDENRGGAVFQQVSKSLDDVTSGLVGRIERILRARDVRSDADEDAPKEYRPLVDKYYRALSEDVEK